MVESIERAQIAAIVADAFGNATVDSIERLTGGVSADVFRLDVGLDDGTARSLVLRVHGRTHSGHGATLEYDLLQSLHAAGVPVAEPLVFDADGRVISDPWLLMKFVDGTTRVPEDESARYISMMANALADVHEVPVEGLPAALPERLDPLPELLDFLPEDSEWNVIRSHLGRLGGTAHAGQPRLLHGDFWPENLLWADGRLSAIIDWEDSALGDPLSDVACTRLELRYLYGIEGMETFTAAYAQRTRVDRRRLSLWQLYVAAAAHRFMGMWGLPPEREAHMRNTALATMRESAEAVMGDAPQDP